MSRSSFLESGFQFAQNQNSKEAWCGGVCPRAETCNKAYAALCWRCLPMAGTSCNPGRSSGSGQTGTPSQSPELLCARWAAGTRQQSAGPSERGLALTDVLGKPYHHLPRLEIQWDELLRGLPAFYCRACSLRHAKTVNKRI